MKLAQTTGDRLIVVPEGKGQPFVLLSVEQYQGLVDGKMSGNERRLTQVASSVQDPSVLTDNYDFEPVAYEESSAGEGNQ